MRIVQLLPTVSYGDAIGNETIAFHGFLKEMGVETGIYAENIDKRVRTKAEVQNFRELPDLEKKDILIYHFSTGWEYLSSILDKQSCRKIMIYHNITPSEFFRPYDLKTCQLVEHGISQLVDNVNKFHYCLSDSKFSQLHLETLGARLPIRTQPLLIDFSDFEEEADREVLARYDDDRTNILFVGRLAPNKCQHDIIDCFARYKEEYDENARLFLVGSFAERGYAAYVEECARESGFEEDIILPGHIPFSHILAYYRLADLFLCLSEHEGFCVPVLEAMKMKVPFLGFDAAAVPETMGVSGVLIKDKRPEKVAVLMHELMEAPQRRRQIVLEQEKRLKDFAYDKIVGEYRAIFKSWIKGKFDE